jgi:hypothetical protein
VDPELNRLIGNLVYARDELVRHLLIQYDMALRAALCSELGIPTARTTTKAEVGGSSTARKGERKPKKAMSRAVSGVHT